MKLTLRFQHIIGGFFGLFLGFSLSRMGFSDFGQVHYMFTLTDFRLLLTFIGAVVLTMLGFSLFTRGKLSHRRVVHRGTIPGGILFGIGWALTGACPAIAFVQVGEGRFPALFTLVGILFGTWIYPKVHARFFKWNPGSCDEL